ncbi:hypothetical protein C3Y87_20760 [Carbonactinospora thermoautotrophica]|uniref:hypothetical protein n=1 Tax=Carbonactinospora thermoautotrophica TaxID=1469144 RepID=UPI00226E2A79|nr:hypothetical protein [Carbonactinospora thermoautotrophica]MCX9193763.1 hypothetical protein [Carbonactinospora thermoautotrophica]
MFPRSHTGFTVPAGGETTVEFDVVAPAGHPPGRWWALVKLAWAGRLRHTETVPVEVFPN